MTEIRIGYARCSTDRQDLAAQQEALVGLGVSPDRIYTDKGLTGSNRQRPGLDQALAVVRQGDTLVVPKLDRLARSVPDVREIADALQAGVSLDIENYCTFSTTKLMLMYAYISINKQVKNHNGS